MNTTKQLQQIKLDQWAVFCKEQAQSGLTVKQWCDQNGYTIHTYNYWKHRLKENYVGSALHDIVPITPPVRKRSIASTFYPPLSSAIIVSYYTQSKKFSA